MRASYERFVCRRRGHRWRAQNMVCERCGVTAFEIEASRVIPSMIPYAAPLAPPAVVQLPLTADLREALPRLMEWAEDDKRRERP